MRMPKTVTIDWDEYQELHAKANVNAKPPDDIESKQRYTISGWDGSRTHSIVGRLTEEQANQLCPYLRILNSDWAFAIHLEITV